MPRCFRLFALLLAAVLAAGSGRANALLPAVPDLSCGGTMGALEWLGVPKQAPPRAAAPLAVVPAVAGLRTFSPGPAGFLARATARLGAPEEQVAPSLPFSLGAPYPNPFTDAATLTYTLDQPGPVRLELFDALGRRVSVIEDEARPAGEYRVRFNGSALMPGLYVVRLTAGDQVATRRLVRSS